MIEDTNYDENVWSRVRGEREAKCFFLGNIYMPPESKSTVNVIQKKFGEITVDLRNYKRRGEVVVKVGDLISLIGKASNSNENTGQ